MFLSQKSTVGFSFGHANLPIIVTFSFVSHIVDDPHDPEDPAKAVPPDY